MIRIAWAMLVAGIVSCPAFAQSTDSLLVALRTAYQQMDYAQAEEEAYIILENFDDHTAEELTEAHVTLAIIRYSRSNLQQSQNHFEAALSLSPHLELDERDVSPKIRSFFQEIKEGILLQDRRTTDQEMQLRYVYVEDLRAGAIWRSMVVPGWGQSYKGENKKGVLFTAGWVTLAGSAVGLHLARSHAQNRYQIASDPIIIEERYQSYNRLHKLRNTAALTAVGLWLGSYLDALHSKKRPNTQTSLVTTSVSPGHLSAIPTLHLTVTF